MNKGVLYFNFETTQIDYSTKITEELSGTIVNLLP